MKEGKVLGVSVGLSERMRVERFAHELNDPGIVPVNKLFWRFLQRRCTR